MSSVDVLNRDKQIKHLKAIIDNRESVDSGITIALNGKWGCGKTFFLNKLIDEYEDSAFIFYYDAWSNDFYDEPLIGMLDCIRIKLNEINKTNNELKALAIGALEFVVNFFDMVAETNIGFKPFKSIRKIHKYFKEKSVILGDSFNPYSEIANAKETIVRAFDKLSSGKFPVIFLVDELDRCDPRYAMKIMERIHHISNNSKAFTIMAVDRDQLENSIEMIYSGGKESATKYLRKIVDMSFDIGFGELDIQKRKEIFGGLEALFMDCDNRFINDSLLSQFEHALFNDLDIRRLKKLIKYTITNHKVVFGNEQKSPLLMCAELFLGCELIRSNNKDSILSEIHDKYRSGTNNSLVYKFIKENLNFNYLRGSQTADGRPLLFVNSLPSYLFYLVSAANRNTTSVSFDIRDVLSDEDNGKLLGRYLYLITKSNI